MARYFIDLRDASGIVRDEEGAQYEDIEDAVDEAKESARDFLRQYMDGRLSLRETCVEVRDVVGRTVVALTVAEVLEQPVHPRFKTECDDPDTAGHANAG